MIAITVIVSAVGGPLAGNIVGQVAGLAFGTQNDFNPASLAAAGAMQYASTAMVSSQSSTFTQAETVTNSAGQVETVYALNGAGKAVAAGAGVLAGAATNKAINNPSGFSWRNVAASMGTAYLGHELGIGTTEVGVADTGGFWTDLAGGAVQSGLSYGIRKALGDDEASWNFRDVAVDSFGNALGNWIAGEIKASSAAEKQAAAEQARRQREQYGFIDWDSIGSISPGQFSNDMVEYAWKKSDEQRALDLSEKMAFFRATDTANGLDPLTTRADYDLPDTFRGSREEAYLGQAYSGIANLLENGSLNDPGATGRALVGGEIGALYGNLVDGSNSISWWNSSSGDALKAYYELGMGRGNVAVAGEQTHLLVFSEAASYEARKLMVTDYVGANVPADELAGYYMAIDDGAAVVDVTAGWYMSASKSLESYSDTFYSRAFMDTNNLLSENMFGRVLELGGKHVGNALLSVFEPAFKGGYFAGDEYAPRAFRQKAAWTLGAEAVASTLAIGELFWAARAAKTGGELIKGSDLPYSSRDIRNTLVDANGVDGVKSTTIPPMNGKNVRLAGLRHPVTGIVFDNKGYPIFDDIAAFDTRLPIGAFREASYTGQMQMATNDLALAIEKGQVNTSMFSTVQLEQINKGKAVIDGFTWHHHQDTGRMQLIFRDIHRRTGHIGWEAMSNGK